MTHLRVEALGLLVHRVMDRGVEDHDHLAIHLDRVRNHDRILVDAGQSGHDARFPVPGRPVEKNGFLGHDGRPEVVQEPVGHHQVGQGGPQGCAVDRDARVLAADGGVVGLQRHGDGPDVVGDEKALGGMFPADAGKGEDVVVSIHPGDFEQLLLTHPLEEVVQERKREPDGLAHLSQRRRAFRVEVAQHDVFDQGQRNVQILGLDGRFGQKYYSGIPRGELQTPRHGWSCVQHVPAPRADLRITN